MKKRPKGRFFIIFFLAGMRGFEPLRTDPESAVLPLDDIPLKKDKKMAGQEGFEPSDDGTKTRCLTAWRLPNTHNLLSGGEGGI